jgi:excisionase family DNA binding protein
MSKASHMTETDGEILTLDEVAAYLKVGKRTVYRLAQKGDIRTFKLGGTWRFRRSDLDRGKYQQEAGGRVIACQHRPRIASPQGRMEARYR